MLSAYLAHFLGVFLRSRVSTTSESELSGSAFAWALLFLEVLFLRNLRLGDCNEISESESLRIPFHFFLGSTEGLVFASCVFGGERYCLSEPSFLAHLHWQLKQENLPINLLIFASKDSVRLVCLLEPLLV